MENKTTVKLILKSPYIKGGKGASEHMNYIATRDGVEMLKYIATRPGVEKHGEHGLFGDMDGVDLDKAKAEITRHHGNVWTHIISLKREDAEHLGYDNAAAWIYLLRSHRNDIAVAMKIDPNHFRWYAAFHNEGDHPHVHMMAWSDKDGEGYLNKDGIADIKSVLLNDICKFDLLPLYKQSSAERNELIARAREELKEFAAFTPNDQQDPELEERLRQLAKKLENVKGKKSYGYLPKPLKREVKDIMTELMSRPELAECYRRWQKVRDEIARYYGDVPAQETPITEQKAFRPIKNAIIQTALQMHEQQEEAVKTGSTVVGGLIAAIAQAIADAPPAPKRQMEFIDRKRRQELARKRQALGLRGRMEQSL